MLSALIGFCSYQGSAQSDFYNIRVGEDSCKQEKIPASKFATLKTNFAYDAIMVPNLGVEYYLGKGYSVGASYWYTWWRSRLSENKQHDYWRSYGAELNVRKYLGKEGVAKPLTGQHIGMLVQIYMYDSRNRGRRGHMSDFSYNVGVEYGYSLPVLKRLNVDFGLALGYVGGKYKVYDQKDGHYVWEGTKYRSFFGPVKIDISFAYQLGKDNINLGKRF